jgi:effector-binding domain-containing protein
MEPCDIVVKSVPQIRTVAVRVSSSQAFDPLFKEARERVSAFVAEHNLKATGPMMGIFYEDPTDPDCDCDFAVAIPTDSPVQADQMSKVLTLPAVDQMTTCILPLSCTPDEVDKVYERILAWIEANHYRIDGPYREIFFEDKSEPVVEIQFPIRR